MYMYMHVHTHTYLLSTQCTSFPHFLSCDQYWGRTMCPCSQLYTRRTHFLLLHTTLHKATCINTCDLVQYKADHLTSLPLLLHLQCLGGEIFTVVHHMYFLPPHHVSLYVQEVYETQWHRITESTYHCNPTFLGWLHRAFPVLKPLCTL